MRSSAIGAPRVRHGDIGLLFMAVTVVSVWWLFGLGKLDSSRPLLAYTTQFAAWICALLLVHRRMGGVRVSDPGVLVLGWAGMYLLYPAALWMRGDHLPYTEQVSVGRIEYIFWAHSLFLVGFGLVYTIVARRRISRTGPFDTSGLPRGKALFILPTLYLLVVAVDRFATSGTLLPSASYGDQWFALQRQVSAARQTGGIGYFVAQVLGKMYFYPILAQGVGAAMLLLSGGVRTLTKWARLWIVIWLVLALVMGNSTRSSVFMVILIGAIIWDRIAGPIRPGVLVATLALGLVMFAFFGYFRQGGGVGVSERASSAVRLYGEQGAPLYEFSVMLGKEAAVAQLVREGERVGPNYFLQAGLSLAPSQLVPMKSDAVSTGDLVSRRILGRRQADLGNGLGGTMVGNGMRVGGLAGVGALGALIGALFALVQRWETNGRRPDQGPSFARVIVAAGFYAWTFAALRGDLATVISSFVYYLLAPYVVLLVLTNRSGSIFARLRPASLSPDPRASSSSGAMSAKGRS